jgi:hypothetical protein
MTSIEFDLQISFFRVEVVRILRTVHVSLCSIIQSLCDGEEVISERLAGGTPYPRAPAPCPLSDQATARRFSVRNGRLLRPKFLPRV